MEHLEKSHAGTESVHRKAPVGWQVRTQNLLAVDNRIIINVKAEDAFFSICSILLGTFAWEHVNVKKTHKNVSLHRVTLKIWSVFYGAPPAVGLAYRWAKRLAHKVFVQQLKGSVPA